MQDGRCHFQDKTSCSRASGNLKHACAFAKASGGVCGGSHMKQEHDVNKHGN